MAIAREDVVCKQRERTMAPGRGRFVLVPRFDARWAIIDREFKYDVVVFCASCDEAEIILTALNREIPRRAKRMSGPATSYRAQPRPVVVFACSFSR